MFGFGPATRIYLAVGATDMRKGFEGLYGLVRDRLQGSPLSGHVFLFCNAARNRLKLLVWDGSGLWICAKKLSRGRFCWPQPGAGEVKATANFANDPYTPDAWLPSRTCTDSGMRRIFDPAN